MAIPGDAKNKANAMKFIDYLLRPRIAADISNYVSYATPNTPARALLDPELAADESVYPNAEVSAKLVDPVSFPADVQRERVRLWTTIKTGK
jgi:putrescine transport system substrate-binding protein